MHVARTTGALVFLVIATGAHAQSRQTPTPPASSVTIRGRVLSAASGDPLRNARVSAGATVVLTDKDGRFEVRATTTRTMLTIGKTGYATTTIAATAREPLDARLAPGAVISGRIFDRNGDPAVNASVRVTRTDEPAARTIVTTDDRGEYRAGSLAAGTYTVAAVAIQGGATPSFAELEPRTVRVGPGEERPDVDFLMSIAGPDGPLFVFASGPAADDRSLPPPGSVRGRVVTPDGRPVVRAQVILGLMRLTPGARAHSTLTNADGDFAFDELVPAPYVVMATKSGYYAARAVQPANVISDVPVESIVTLEPTATVAGTVLDETGDPVQGVAVQALEVRYERGRRRLMPASDARYTDDRGAFRVFGLRRGSYVISAAVDGVQALDIPGYARAYYPGTADAAQAQFISISSGRSVDGVTVWMTRTATARISGRLLDAAGQPTTGGNVTLVPSQHSPAVTSVPAGARIERDGRFEFPNVPPGQYVIQANRGRQGSIEGEFGALPVTVNGRDVTGLVLQTSKGSTVAGRITFLSSGGADAPPPRQVELGAVPVDYDLSPPQFAIASVADDGAFTLGGLNGPRRLTVVRAPAGWAVRDIRINGIDVTDRAIQFGRVEQSVGGVEVTLTDRASAVAGTVADDRGRGSPAVPVIVFTTDRSQRYPQSRFVANTVTDNDGNFAVRGLPAGTYYAASPPRLPSGDDGWRDPQLLESLERDAVAVTLGDGGNATARLRAAAP